VLGLAKERGVSLIVKSKSMTTEEVDLNERLEHHGLEAVETDLGEYILQLARERPYHMSRPRCTRRALTWRRFLKKELHVALRNRPGEVIPVARACCARNFWTPASASPGPISWWPIREP